jgi:hypothetical protein
MSRVESASVCSEPKSPGGSSVRFATTIWSGVRPPEMGAYISPANVTPTPEEPQKARAPAADAPRAMESWSCSPPPIRNSAVSSPLFTSFAISVMIPV